MDPSDRLSGDEEIIGALAKCCSCFKKSSPANSSSTAGADVVTDIVCDHTTDRSTLLAFMYTRFREKRASYKYSSSLYRRLDTFCFFIPLMVLQCGVSIVYAVGNSNEEFQRYFSGVASAVSALIIAVQNRMKFGESSKQFQNGARQYSLLASETFTKWLSSSNLTEQQFQAFVTDTGQLEKEIQDTCPVPPAWVTLKYEKHRLIMRRGDQHDDCNHNNAPALPPQPQQLLRKQPQPQQQRQQTASTSTSPMAMARIPPSSGRGSNNVQAVGIDNNGFQADAVTDAILFKRGGPQTPIPTDEGTNLGDGESGGVEAPRGGAISARLRLMQSNRQDVAVMQQQQQQQRQQAVIPASGGGGGGNTDRRDDVAVISEIDDNFG